VIRDILLVIYAVGWLVVLIVTVWRTGKVPAELWGALGLGVGAILGLFPRSSAEGGRGRRGRAGEEPEAVEDRP
jgi:hypothetical protein